MKASFFILLLMVFCFDAKASDPPSIIEVQGTTEILPLFQQLDLSIDLNSSVINHYDYDSIQLTASLIAPSGKLIQVDGYFYQHFYALENGQLQEEGDPYWKLKFTPNEVGTWHYQLKVNDVFGADSLTNLSFECNNSTEGGFVYKPEGSNYLKNDAGQTIFLVGENIAWANQPDGTDNMAYYLQKLHDNEMNFAKLMMTPWGYQIEWWPYGLKKYGNRQKEAFLMDSIFDFSKELGIYLQLAFSIHNELNFGYPAEDWTSHPYNLANGGMCENPWDFFSNLEAKSAFRNRLRYLNARWGYATNLMGWELLSEADNFPWYSDYKQEVAAWGNEMSSYLKTIDVNKHLISVGFALTGSNPQVWEHEDIGFTQMHIYDKVRDIEGDVFRQVGLYTQLYNKPMVVGEFGLGHIGDSLVVWDPEGIAIHNALWTSSLAGTPVAVVPWFWENYIDYLQLYPVFTPVKRFMENEALADVNYQPTHIRSRSQQSDDWQITPKYNNLSARSPSRYFQLHTTGQIVPGTDSLTQTLFGPSSLFAGLRQPPEITSNWESASYVIVETGAQALSSILQFSIDGVVVLEEPATSYTEYVVGVSEGIHTIKIDNIGGGFFSLLEINKITIEDFLPGVRAFGLLSDSKALLWIHNRHSNWNYLYENGQLPEPSSGELLLPISSGEYALEWYNSWSGDVDSVGYASSSDEGLVVPISNLVRDIALKVSKIVDAEENKIVYPTLLVYPNPSSVTVNFVFELDQAQDVTLQLMDARGRLVYHKNISMTRSGVMKLKWDGNDLQGNLLDDGIYFYRLIVNKDKVWNGRIVRI